MMIAQTFKLRKSVRIDKRIYVLDESIDRTCSIIEAKYEEIRELREKQARDYLKKEILMKSQLKLIRAMSEVEFSATKLLLKEFDNSRTTD